MKAFFHLQLGRQVLSINQLPGKIWTVWFLLSIVWVIIWTNPIKCYNKMKIVFSNLLKRRRNFCHSEKKLWQSPGRLAKKAKFYFSHFQALPFVQAKCPASPERQRWIQTWSIQISPQFTASAPQALLGHVWFGLPGGSFDSSEFSNLDFEQQWHPWSTSGCPACQWGDLQSQHGGIRVSTSTRPK